MLEVSLCGVGTVLRLEGVAWSLVKRLRRPATNDYAPLQPFATKHGPKTRFFFAVTASRMVPQRLVEDPCRPVGCHPPSRKITESNSAISYLCYQVQNILRYWYDTWKYVYDVYMYVYKVCTYAKYGCMYTKYVYMYTKYNYVYIYEALPLFKSNSRLCRVFLGGERR